MSELKKNISVVIPVYNSSGALWAVQEATKSPDNRAYALDMAHQVFRLAGNENANSQKCCLNFLFSWEKMRRKKFKNFCILW